MAWCSGGGVAVVVRDRSVSGTGGLGAGDGAQVGSDDAPADPALDSGGGCVAAAAEVAPALEHADAALGTSPEAQRAAEPALALVAAPRGRGAARFGQGDAADAHLLGDPFVLG